MKINYEKFLQSYIAVFNDRPGKGTEDTLKALVTEFNKHGEERIPLFKQKVAYMFATVRHECGPRMLPIVENMNYSAKRLMQVWPSRFKTLEQAKKYEYNPELLGNTVYANRLGNGDVNSGDGYRYRGRGIGAQFTGKENYKKFGKIFEVNLVDNPEIACDLELGAKILFSGSIGGLFTGVSLSKYINEQKVDYVNARRVINADVSLNGLEIAKLARNFEIVLDNSFE